MRQPVVNLEASVRTDASGRSGLRFRSPRRADVFRTVPFNSSRVARRKIAGRTPRPCTPPASINRRAANAVAPLGLRATDASGACLVQALTQKCHILISCRPSRSWISDVQHAEPLVSCAGRHGKPRLAQLGRFNRRAANKCSRSLRRNSHQAATPSPFCADSVKIFSPGCTRRASFSASFTENGTYGSKSALLITTTSLVRNALGYLPGLSSPSVVLSRSTRRCSPRSCDAGQIKIADIFDEQKSSRGFFNF